MYFRDLQERLIDIARVRVRGGVLTERGLARLSGISQPHIHHVLNHVRLLSPAATDRLMKALDLRVSDVLWRSAADPEPDVRAIPLVCSRIGPASDGILTLISGDYPFPERLLRNLVDPLAARLGPDLAMPARLAVRDLVLLDRNPRLRSTPPRRRRPLGCRAGPLPQRPLSPPHCHSSLSRRRSCAPPPLPLAGDPARWTEYSGYSEGTNCLDWPRSGKRTDRIA